MGWTYTIKEPGTSIKDFFAREFNYDRDGKTGKVIACAVKNYQTAYLAYEQVINGKREVFAIVCLLDYKRNDVYNFGYKDMDETMGPYYHDCPESIIKLLTPTQDTTAIEWRSKCQDNAEKKRSSPKPGSILRFSQSIQFRNGRNRQFLQLRKGSIFLDELGQLFRLPRWQNREYAVVSSWPAA